MRLRAEREVPVALRSRRSQLRLPRPVGDRGVQAAQALPERGQVQEDLRNLDRVQGDRIQDCQRAQVIT